jgi:hypothetical protein
MKTTHLTYSILLTLLFSVVVAAQRGGTKSDPTDLIVLDQNWHKDFVGAPRDSNPLQPNEDLIRQTRAEKTAIRERDDYSLPNKTTEERLPVPMPRPVAPASARSDVYVYKITVKNNGPKKIKAVEWEYQFLRPETHDVMGSRRMTSRVKLSPGQTTVIQASLLQKPAHVVSADQLEKKYRDQFKEQVIIHRIDYTDGTVWRRQP